jgi:hypothetical protein
MLVLEGAGGAAATVPFLLLTVADTGLRDRLLAILTQAGREADGGREVHGGRGYRTVGADRMMMSRRSQRSWRHSGHIAFDFRETMYSRDFPFRCRKDMRQRGCILRSAHKLNASNLPPTSLSLLISISTSSQERQKNLSGSARTGRIHLRQRLLVVDEEGRVVMSGWGRKLKKS